MLMDALFQGFPGPFLDLNHHAYMDLPSLSSGGERTHQVSPSSSSGLTSEGEAASDEGDFSDATLKLISQMLMEEDDLENRPCMYQECSALQATEKSFYDALGEKYPPFSDENIGLDSSVGSPDGSCSRNSSIESSSSPLSVNNDVYQSNWVRDRENHERDLYSDYTFESILQAISASNGSSRDASVVSHLSPSQISDSSFHGSRSVVSRRREAKVAEESVSKVADDAEKTRREKSLNGSREKKTHQREDAGFSAVGGRNTKQLAGSAEESDEPLEMYDKVLLCPQLNPHLHLDGPSMCLRDHDDSALIEVGKNSQVNQNMAAKGSKGGGRGRSKKGANKKEVVDLRTLLSQCAQAVSSADIRSANELLSRIRQHSSAFGDSTERLAYHVANALEARLEGTGTSLYAAFTTKRTSAADILRGYQVYVRACPLNKMSNTYANRSIGKLVQNSQSVHIIDFGILYGFQWPCLIQQLSVRASGPPKIRITGIDFPQPGFRPAGRVEETGRRLATYCKRFNVPFEFNAIAKKWETIDLEDLKIESDEVLVVNCLYRLRNVPDETVVANSPRDAVLNLVKRINPDMFIHGVVTGTYNAPFFITRFREALFHFSALFDMFEATVPREDEPRMMFETEIFGRDIMNIIACEGTERVERPETYKQWQVRNVRAGFRQLPLNQEIVREVKAMVKLHYHKDFVVGEDGKWMLQGWKGRIMYALSCWKPSKE